MYLTTLCLHQGKDQKKHTQKTKKTQNRQCTQILYSPSLTTVRKEAGIFGCLAEASFVQRELARFTPLLLGQLRKSRRNRLARPRVHLAFQHNTTTAGEEKGTIVRVLRLRHPLFAKAAKFAQDGGDGKKGSVTNEEEAID